MFKKSAIYNKWNVGKRLDYNWKNYILCLNDSFLASTLEVYSYLSTVITIQACNEEIIRTYR